MNPRHAVAVPIRHPDRFFIGGSWVQPSEDTSFNVIDPTTEDVFYRAAAAGPDDVDRAVAAARAAFDTGPWPTLTYTERAEYLRAIAAAVRRRRADLAMLWSGETGAVHSQALDALLTPPEIYEFYADLAESFPFVERYPDAPDGTGRLIRMLVREPVGVVGAIIPWNGPSPMIAFKAAPALLSGCTVVIKSSPEAPGAGHVMAEIAEEVGLPPGVWNAVTADRENSELLVRDPRVDKITFTGSTTAGRRIASICGDRVARCTLELGGKSAAVILDDYDLAAVASALGTTWHWAGQVCAALTRAIVTRDRQDDLIAALKDTFTGVKIGDPYDESTQLGPLAIRRQRDRVERFLLAGQEEGATLVTGGRRPERLERGFFIEPTVFANVDNRSTLAREEIFGPVLSVIPADSEEHAIALANDTSYGLNASVFTNDTDRALSVARRLRSGTVGHNGFRSDWKIAFGGFKQSGTGRECGREGVYPFTESKTVILAAEPAGSGRCRGVN
jgi:aldehyde dehydrogenase (NAD+)